MSVKYACVIAFVTGFVALSYEILWFRVYSFASGSSPAAFGILIGYYLTGLAIGAHAAGLSLARENGRRPESVRRLLISVLLIGNLAAYLVIPALNWLITRVYWVQLGFLVTFAAVFFGATLPLVGQLAIRAERDSGFQLGWIYLANILGSAAGSLVTGFCLLEVFAIRQASIAVVALAVVAIVVLAFGLERRRPVRWVVLAFAGFALTTVYGETPRLFDRLYERLLFKGEDQSARFERVVENRSGVIAVARDGEVWGGGAYDGMVATDIVNDRNAIVRAYVVPGLHHSPKNVLMIGLATGAWAQVIAGFPGVETLTIVEINPGYLELISRYSMVSSLLRNPKVNILIDDGRRWLRHNPGESFDVIVQNTTEHDRALSTNLLSVEYMTLVRSHLKPGGVFYFNTTDSEDAFKTAFASFAYGLRFVNFAAVSDSAFRLDLAEWQGLLLRYRIDGRPVIDTSDVRARERLQWFAALPRSLDRAPARMGFESRASMMSKLGAAGIITDDNMLPEWREVGIRR